MVVLQPGLKLSTLGVLALGPPGTCRPTSVAICVLPGATWHELQSDLQIVATCAGLRDAQARPSL